MNHESQVASREITPEVRDACEQLIHHNLAVIEAHKIGGSRAVTAVEALKEIGVPYRASLDFLIAQPWKEEVQYA